MTSAALAAVNLLGALGSLLEIVHIPAKLQ
jgi:hypothetical protein